MQIFMHTDTHIHNSDTIKRSESAIFFLIVYILHFKIPYKIPHIWQTIIIIIKRLVCAINARYITILKQWKHSLKAGNVAMFPTRIPSLLSFFCFTTSTFPHCSTSPCLVRVTLADLRRLSVVLVPFHVSFCHSWCSSPYRVRPSLCASPRQTGGWNYLPAPRPFHCVVVLDVVLWRCVGVKHPVAKQPDLPRLRGETGRRYTLGTHTHTHTDTRLCTYVNPVLRGPFV